MNLAINDSEGINTPGMTASEGLPALVTRFAGEFREMPGLRLTSAQAGRLFGVHVAVATVVLDELVRADVLARSCDGRYALTYMAPACRDGLAALVTAPARVSPARAPAGSSNDVPLELLSRLIRSWTLDR